MSADHDDDVELGARGALPAEDGEGGGGAARGGGQRPAAARLVGVGHVVVGADLGVGHHARVWDEAGTISNNVSYSPSLMTHS